MILFIKFVIPVPTTLVPTYYNTKQGQYP